MKKVFFLVGILSMLFACEKESVEEKQSTVEVNESHNLSYRDCKFVEVNCLDVVSGQLTISNQICNRYFICDERFDFGDFCLLLPCKPDLSAWEFPDLTVPSQFGSLMDKFKLDLDPSISGVQFALNSKTTGMQIYKEAGFLKDNVYNAKTTLILDAKTCKKLGLWGNVVKAGKYPVIVNVKNGTRNVILDVERGFK